MCALQHFKGIDDSFTEYQQWKIEYGNMQRGIIPSVYMKSTCNSPLLGDYLGTFSPKDFWVAMILRGKEIIVDHQGEEAKYPKQVPRIFRTAPFEDYKKEYCVSLCQQKRNISWEAIYNHQLNTCDIDDLVKDSLCSSTKPRLLPLIFSWII